MLNTTIYSWKEGFLNCFINIFIGNEVVSEPLGKDEVVELSNAICQGNHSKVGGIICRSFFMNKFNKRF